MPEKQRFDFNQAIVTTFIGGGIILLPLLWVMLAVGFNDQDVAEVWGSLGIIWAPAFFIWGGMPAPDDDGLR